ncbi:MAG TPA: 4'-phosphopantetheinyl transferase superfamily protein [Stellaceae bacterium]|nr:4'-phosphopantetheinyl transferase superfamily protein [Stellaceae bacterium]
MRRARGLETLPLQAWLSALPRLARGEVHVILARLPPPAGNRGAPAILDRDEQRRRRRLVFAADRHRFAWSHAVLRIVLAHYLGRAAAAVPFAPRSDPQARPRLLSGARLRVGFSLSHAGDFAAVAVARGEMLGVDVELPRDRLDILAIAAAHFAPTETAMLQALAPTERMGAFLRLWTAKEAVLKALGTGLTRPLSDVVIAAGESTRHRRLTVSTKGIALWSLARAGGTSATLAVATERSAHPPRVWIGTCLPLSPRKLRLASRCRRGSGTIPDASCRRC